jgi:hypothetical protein
VRSSKRLGLSRNCLPSVVARSLTQQQRQTAHLLQTGLPKTPQLLSTLSIKAVSGISASSTITASCYVKFDSPSRNFSLQVTDAPSGGSGYAELYLTQSGVVTSPTPSSFTNRTATVENVGSGWYRVRLTITTAAVTTITIRLFIVNASNVQVYLGDGTSPAYYIWGAQLEQASTVGEYIPTTSTINSAARYDHDPISLIGKGLLLEEARTNLLVQSENFGTTWTTLGLLAFGSGSTLDAIAAPNGQITADLLTEDSANSEHRVGGAAISWAGNTSYTFTIHAKSAGHTRFDLLFGTGGNWSGGRQVVFDLSNGTVNATDGATGSITALPNGWYRCRMTALTVASPSASSAFLRFLDNTSGSVFTGDGTSGIYLWGAQLEAGAFPTSYIPTTTATVTRAADISTSVATSVFESSWYRRDEGTVFAEAKSRREPLKYCCRCYY